jgi:alkylation response protein AidB-like acyl-CoA dehydrogenase
LDNPFLQEVFRRFSEDEWEDVNERVRAFSQRVSKQWRRWSEENARVENHPRLRHYDAHNHRIDRIIRPHEMLQLEKEVFSEGLFSKRTSPTERAMKRYLLHSNGEAGITCPVACTDGLVALLEAFEDQLSPPLKEILDHTKEGKNGEFAVGAQFMSEIQGGSNIPANLLEAVPDGENYRLYGNKFFCSAAHADYSVVTARVQGTNHVAVFVVPTWLTGDKEKEKRNGHVLNRLKWKMGTCELPSAEIDYQGALAYPIGSIEKGVSLAVGIVLTLSRIDIGFASAAFMMRAARETLLYGRFRHVFDRRMDEFPMASAQIQMIEDAAKRGTAAAFSIYDAYRTVQESQAPSDQQRFDIRVLILIQKIFASKEASEVLKTAISIFGGHGAIEDFSSIPRLFRDAMVNELWEGPRNVLLAQVYRDIKKNQSWYPPEELLANLLPDGDHDQVEQCRNQLRNLLTINLYDFPTEENRKAASQWEQLWGDIFKLYQQQALSQYPNLKLLPADVLDAVSN